MDVLDLDDDPFHPGSGLTASGSMADLQMDGTPAQFDPIHMLSSWNLVQRQEAAARLAAESMAARAGRGRTDGFDSGLRRSGPNLLWRSEYFSSPRTGGLARQHCDSRESLDRCLLSATNGNTDASVADDGISVRFPADRNSLWCFNAGNAVSSGEFGCGEAAAVRAAGSGSDADPSSDLNFNSEKFQPRLKKCRAESRVQSSLSINFQQPSFFTSSAEERDTEAMAQMKEMIYRAAAFRPVNFGGAEVTERRKRRNVRISTDPQTVAARKRRERISERIMALQQLVPGGSKMDTASMLDEAANYLKYLRSQVKALEGMSQKRDESSSSSSLNFDPALPSSSSSHPFNDFFGPMQPNFCLHSHK